MRFREGWTTTKRIITTRGLLYDKHKSSFMLVYAPAYLEDAPESRFSTH